MREETRHNTAIKQLLYKKSLKYKYSSEIVEDSLYLDMVNKVNSNIPDIA